MKGLDWTRWPWARGKAVEPPRPEGAMLVASVGSGGVDNVDGRLFLASAPVFAAVTLKSEAVARPPLRLYQGGEGDGKVITEHPVLNMVHDPTANLRAAGLMRQTEASLNIWGEAFWGIEVLPRPSVRWLENWLVQPETKGGEFGGVRYFGEGGYMSYPAERVVFFRSLNPLSRLRGVGPLKAAEVAVTAANNAGDYNKEFFTNGARPDFILTSNEPLTQSVVEDFYKSWDDRHKGSGKAHRPALASLISGVHGLGFNHVDMDFVNSLRWSLEEVARAFGVPKTLLAELERATFSNFIASERIFWRNTVIPRLRYIEEELNEQLLPKAGFDGVRFGFDLSSIEALLDDSVEAARRDSLLLEKGVVTINEVRARRGLAPVAWGNQPFAGSRDGETGEGNE